MGRFALLVAIEAALGTLLWFLWQPEWPVKAINQFRMAEAGVVSGPAAWWAYVEYGFLRGYGRTLLVAAAIVVLLIAARAAARLRQIRR